MVAANLGASAPIMILEAVLLAIVTPGVLLWIIGWHLRSAARREQPGLLVRAVYRLIGTQFPDGLPTVGSRQNSLNTALEAGADGAADRKRPCDHDADSPLSRSEGWCERLEGSADDFAH